MKSYASVDRIEGNYAVCEVELLSVEESKPEDFAIKDCEMMDLYLQEITKNLNDINVGDILIVEHDYKNITYIYCKDEEEKAKRLEILEGIIS